MKKILTIISFITFLLSCNVNAAKKQVTYDITVTEGRRQSVYSTSKYTLNHNNGCVEFVDEYGQHRICCGTFNIKEIK
jgi:hypothetical protein